MGTYRPQRIIFCGQTASFCWAAATIYAQKKSQSVQHELIATLI